LLVKPDVARAQLDAEAAELRPQPGSGSGTGGDPVVIPPGGGGDPAPVKASGPRRFHGTVVLDPNRVGRDAGKIAEEVIVHLAGLVGANVRVSLEIQADFTNEVPDNVVRTVTENSVVLKFASHGFERE
jgi:hypothetical protein